MIQLEMLLLAIGSCIFTLKVNKTTPSPVRFLFRGPMRSVRSGVLVVVLCRSIHNHSGQGQSGATGRSQGRHCNDIVNVGWCIARVLVPVRIDMDGGRAGGIPFGW